MPTKRYSRRDRRALAWAVSAWKAVAERLGFVLAVPQAIDSKEYIELSSIRYYTYLVPVTNSRLQSRTLSYTDLAENSNE
jgi:hypothetical protein